MRLAASTEQALPPVRLANQLVDGGRIVIRNHTGSALLGNTIATEVVVYEADQLDRSPAPAGASW
ncbi:hypothetical protein ABZ848_38720 [Streptomyces sp. NPDC047081]|uniref:hypothetical protein n=1 Tax=Streptomyces sp. NPDC047081 TaxID=3154706 RepID=UPI0033F5C73B